jgi:hypothetical protein
MGRPKGWGLAMTGRPVECSQGAAAVGGTQTASGSDWGARSRRPPFARVSAIGMRPR